MNTTPPANTEILDRIVPIIADAVGAPVDKIDLQTRFVEDLHVSSMEVVTLAVLLEDEFGGRVSEEEVGQLSDVASLIAYIEQRIDAEK